MMRNSWLVCCSSPLGVTSLFLAPLLVLLLFVTLFQQPDVSVFSTKLQLLHPWKPIQSNLSLSSFTSSSSSSSSSSSPNTTSPAKAPSPSLPPPHKTVMESYTKSTYSPSPSPSYYDHSVLRNFSHSVLSNVSAEVNRSTQIDREAIKQSGNSEKKRIIRLSKVDVDLAKAREAIKSAALYRNQTIDDRDYVPNGIVYHNSHAFHRSYVEMEKVFRVYVYGEGWPPLVHDGPCKSIYSSEGRFIHAMNSGNKFVTRDPKKAHAFFLPFSIAKMIMYIYVRNSFDTKPVKKFVVDYIDTVDKKYGFWSRNLGADHFMVSCHDWAPLTSAAVPNLYHNSIRVLCNANTSEGFVPRKDVTLPEINLVTGKLHNMLGGPSPSQRSVLAFFAGGLHGPIRPAVLNHWKGKDDDIQVYEYLPKGVSYYKLMRNSKYCLCPSGYEVASPRLVEAIYMDCVPVIIKEGYILPFSDVLNWKSFSVSISVADIPKLKEILSGISTRRYLNMYKRVKLVKRHFVVNSSPQRFDVFHMILHSVWLRRLNQPVAAQ